MERVEDDTLSLSDYDSCFEEVEKVVTTKEQSKGKTKSFNAKEEDDENVSLIKIVFSWSLKDALNENLYRNKVHKIPETFNSASHYLNSFISPLIEETHSDLCSSLKDVSRARACEISSVDRDKFFKLPNDLFYLVPLKKTKNEVDDEVQNSGKYEPEPGDVIAFTDIKPKRIDDLNRAETCYHIAYVCGPKDANTYEIPILSSKSMEMDVESHFGWNRNKKLFAIYLLNLTTNVRTWKALNSQLKSDENMKITEKVLQPDSNVGEKCINCSPGGNDKFLSFLERSLLLRSQTLNESQKDAISSCVSMAKCDHNDIKLIWGPPGTGKTKTLACMLLFLQKFKHRTLACAPTNTAVLQVAQRLHCLVNGSLGFETYGLGDIVLMGNRTRMKLDSYPGLLDVFLDHRVENLRRCFAPLSGWNHNLELMIQLLEDPKKQYSLYERDRSLVSLEDFAMEKDSTARLAYRVYIRNKGGFFSMSFEDYLKKERKDIVEKFRSEKLDKGEGIMTIEEFIKHRFGELTKKLKLC